MILVHRKSTRSEAKSKLKLLLFLNVSMPICLYLFRPVWGEDPWFWLLILLAYLAANVIGCIIVTRNLSLNEAFVCEIDEKEIRCRCPEVGFGVGESFAVAISDIVAIEKKTSDDEYCWYIRDTRGRRFFLTEEYENPAKQFIELIQELNSEVEVVTT